MKITLHGTAVAINGRGALFIGKPNSGKSASALQFCALGGDLLADDAVIIENIDGKLQMTCPKPIAQMIEVRGIGLLKVKNCERADLDYIVDMDHNEIARLPVTKRQEICGITVPCLSGKGAASLVNALFCLLNGGEIVSV